MVVDLVLDGLNSTTQRVYRFLYRQGGKPVGVHDVQNGLALSSPSVAHYHIRKLVDQGLAREEAGGYVVDKLIFENMIRIRRAVIPFQTTYLALFASTFVILLTVFRSDTISGAYIFALLVNALAIGIFIYETMKSLRQKF
ncbi:MAG: helix-turn-helix transcriptional regulator [Nitrososphaerota archaeon]|jgi:hypothetical protein|nr:helix-turn-helix transcriptional regulator [Nitrososphaerota archaeon]MDG6922456.1 helix-turn-helix transcriptional regulator [Nitrososphaerota archaeon]